MTSTIEHFVYTTLILLMCGCTPSPYRDVPYSTLMNNYETARSAATTTDDFSRLESVLRAALRITERDHTLSSNTRVKRYVALADAFDRVYQHDTAEHLFKEAVQLSRDAPDIHPDVAIHAWDMLEAHYIYRKNDKALQALQRMKH